MVGGVFALRCRQAHQMTRWPVSWKGLLNMNSIAVRRAAGVFLVVVPLAFTVCFSLLAQLFDYPAILRQPTSDVLTRFAAGGAGLIAVWYVLTLSAVAFVPLTVLVHRVLA